MTTININYESGYGGWLVGKIPNGVEVEQMTRCFLNDKGDQYKSLKNKSRFNSDVRVTYEYLLSLAFRKYKTEDDISDFSLLYSSRKESNLFTLLSSLQCGNDEDHILVASSNKITIKEFINEVQEKYKFNQTDPEYQSYKTTHIVDSKGTLVEPPTSTQAFVVGASIILEPYVRTINEPGYQARKYFEGLGFIAP